MRDLGDSQIELAGMSQMKTPFQLVASGEEGQSASGGASLALRLRVYFKRGGHPQAASERDASWPPAEHAAILHAAQKLEAEGARLGHPHTSAVQGEAGKGLRELRPRGGRSRWRPIYRQVAPDTFVILAVAPEAEIDRAGFDAAVTRARRRLDELDAE